MSVTTPVTGTPTQVAHPWKTTLRTIVQSAIAIIPGLVFVLPAIISAILEEPSIPEELRATLLGISAGVLALIGIVTRIMAIPGVNDLLEKIKLGTGVENEEPVVNPANADQPAVVDETVVQPEIEGFSSIYNVEDGPRHRQDGPAL